MAKKNRNKDTNSRRRKGPGTRTTSEPILLFVQGKCTEKDYFTLLKRRLRLQSLTIKVESQSPENLIKQTKTTISRDKDAPFSAIYYVVDVDDTSDEQFRQAFKAAKDTTKLIQSLGKSIYADRWKIRKNMSSSLVLLASKDHSCAGKLNKLQLIAKPNTTLWCLMKVLKPGS